MAEYKNRRRIGTRYCRWSQPTLSNGFWCLLVLEENKGTKSPPGSSELLGRQAVFLVDLMSREYHASTDGGLSQRLPAFFSLLFSFCSRTPVHLQGIGSPVL